MSIFVLKLLVVLTQCFLLHPIQPNEDNRPEVSLLNAEEHAQYEVRMHDFSIMELSMTKNCAFKKLPGKATM